MSDVFGLPFRATTRVDEYDEGLTPGVDEPSRSTEREFWFEADGSVVLDEARIAEIEAGITTLEGMIHNA